MSDDRPDAERGPAPRPFTLPQVSALLVILGGLLVLLFASSLPWPGREESVTLDRLPVRALDYKIAINDASWAELIQLPEVGPKLAERIIAEREKKGPFRDAAGLERVPGLGPRTIEKLLPYVTFEVGGK